MADFRAFPAIDLHTHTTVSDGTDAPAELLARARAAGLQLFSITDHDAVKAAGTVRGLLGPGDPGFVCGVEFSCRDEAGRYHILGYGFDPDAPALREVVDAGHRLRMEKTAARLERLKSRFGIALPREETDRLLALDNPGKPHLGNLLVRYGCAATKEQAIAEIIDRLGVTGEFLRPGQAIRGILGAGGIPVLAHPPFGSGSQRITGPGLDRRVRRLAALGLQGLEGFYSGYTPGLRDGVLALARAHGLYVTAGSDFHGANKPVALGDIGPRDIGCPEGLGRFLEAIRERSAVG